MATDKHEISHSPTEELAAVVTDVLADEGQLENVALFVSLDDIPDTVVA